MENYFRFTKPKLENLALISKGNKPDIFHDTHLDANGLQLRVSSTKKVFFIQKRINGRPERVTIGDFPAWSVENARKEAGALKTDIAKGINPNSDARTKKTETTLKELFDDFLEHRRKKDNSPLSDKTKRTYKYDFDFYLGKWGKRKLSELKENHFATLHRDITKEHPTTANRVIAMASSLFSHAQERKLYRGENPAKGIKKNSEISRDRWLQQDELPAFFTALAEEENQTLKDYFLIALLTGARSSNVKAMAWSQINFSLAEWRIPKTKNGKPQTITLTAEALAVLQGRHDNQSAFVFPSSSSASGHIEEPKKAWKRILERAGLQDLRIHDLRRTLGSWQMRTGASLGVIGKSLNHSTPSTTAIYARLDLDPVRESVERATGAILSAAGLKDVATVISLKKTGE